MNDFTEMLTQFSIDFMNEFAPSQAKIITLAEARKFIEEWSEKNTTQIN